MASSNPTYPCIVLALPMARDSNDYNAPTVLWSDPSVRDNTRDPRRPTLDLSHRGWWSTLDTHRPTAARNCSFRNRFRDAPKWICQDIELHKSPSVWSSIPVMGNNQRWADVAGRGQQPAARQRHPLGFHFADHWLGVNIATTTPGLSLAFMANTRWRTSLGIDYRPLTASDSHKKFTVADRAI